MIDSFRVAGNIRLNVELNRYQFSAEREEFSDKEHNKLQNHRKSHSLEKNKRENG